MTQLRQSAFTSSGCTTAGRRKMVISDPDIWRAANLLIDQHGAEAEKVAIRRAEEMNEQNDLGGLLTWIRIRDAIVHLQSKPSGMAH